MRPIVSGSGSILENPSKFVDIHLKEHADKHKSYIQGTPDFIRQEEKLNDKGKLPENELLVTLDAISLYTNVPQKEGVNCAGKVLNKRENMQVPSEYIIVMLKLIL